MTVLLQEAPVIVLLREAVVEPLRQEIKQRFSQLETEQPFYSTISDLYATEKLGAQIMEGRRMPPTMPP